MLWNATNTVFYVLINDYMLKKTDMNGDEVAFGVTISGNILIKFRINNHKGSRVTWQYTSYSNFYRQICF